MASLCYCTKAARWQSKVAVREPSNDHQSTECGWYRKRNATTDNTSRLPPFGVLALRPALARGRKPMLHQKATTLLFVAELLPHAAPSSLKKKQTPIDSTPSQVVSPSRFRVKKRNVTPLKIRKSYDFKKNDFPRRIHTKDRDIPRNTTSVSATAPFGGSLYWRTAHWLTYPTQQCRTGVSRDWQ